MANCGSGVSLCVFLCVCAYMCVMSTVPMPVSGGWAVFEARTGAAFAPIAVAGGVSILGWRETERGRSMLIA